MGLLQRLKEFWAGNQIIEVRIPDGSPAPPVRRRYRFSGLVQGVGFRYEAMGFALRLGLTGWARNENDGTVTIEVQGAANYIDEFLRAMRAVPRFDITAVRAEDLPLSEGESTFEALYW